MLLAAQPGKNRTRSPEMTSSFEDPIRSEQRFVRVVSETSLGFPLGICCITHYKERINALIESLP